MKLIRFTAADSPNPLFGVVVRDHAVPFATLQSKAGKPSLHLTDIRGALNVSVTLLSMLNCTTRNWSPVVRLISALGRGTVIKCPLRVLGRLATTAPRTFWVPRGFFLRSASVSTSSR